MAAPTNPRKTAAASRRTTTPPRPAVTSGPFVDLDAMAAETENPGTVHLFTLNGQEYHIPAEPSAALTLQYLDLVSTAGQEAAAGWLLKGMLGADAYTALMNYEDLTMRMLASVMQAVQKHVLGAAEKAGGIGVPLA